MIKKLLMLPFLVCLMLASGVAYSQDALYSETSVKGENIVEENTRGYFSQVLGFDIKSIAVEGLYETISDWLGTPYCYSGKSYSGIDCSGFVNMLYSKIYQISLAGSAAEIYTRVNLLGREDLKEGDLVFFRIHKKRISHIGIYLGENKFAHASTQRGVIISDLGEPYYKKYFVKGGRPKNTF